MTREEATIKVLRGHIKSVEEIIKALEQEPLEVEAAKLQKAYNKGFEDCRQAVQDYIAKYLSQYLYNDVRQAVEAIDEYIGELPSVKQEPKIGHWIAIDEKPHEDYECDKCGYTISTYTANIEPHTEYKYCPNCGCRMESEG